MMDQCDFEGEGWTKKVEVTRPNVETDATVLEVRELKAQMTELKRLIQELGDGKAKEGGKNGEPA